MAEPMTLAWGRWTSTPAVAPATAPTLVSAATRSTTAPAISDTWRWVRVGDRAVGRCYSLGVVVVAFLVVRLSVVVVMRILTAEAHCRNPARGTTVVVVISSGLRPPKELTTTTQSYISPVFKSQGRCDNSVGLFPSPFATLGWVGCVSFCPPQTTRNHNMCHVQSYQTRIESSDYCLSELTPACCSPQL